ncbi:MAG: PspC domain-containing protein [Anaerolineales bacterium]|nr:PspC domain-containing protein [Anaerolineales bacterium]
MNDQNKRLFRSRDERMVAGVCGGLAEYLGMDPTIVRLLFVLVFFFGGSALLIYLVMMIVVPEEPLPGGYTPEVVESEVIEEE